jgi:hypothetical protein
MAQKDGYEEEGENRKEICVEAALVGLISFLFRNSWSFYFTCSSLSEMLRSC